MTPPATEAQIQRAILAELGALPWLRIWRVNVGAGQIADGRFARFGVKGQADISGIVLPYGRRLELEVKTHTGRVSEAQRRWGQMIERFGGAYAVVRSVEEAMAAADDARGLLPSYDAPEL